MGRRMIGGMTVAGDLVGVLAGRCDSSPFGRGGALESPTSSRHEKMLSGNFVDRTASWFHVVAAGTLRGETQGVSPPGPLQCKPSCLGVLRQHKGFLTCFARPFPGLASRLLRGWAAPGVPSPGRWGSPLFPLFSSFSLRIGVLAPRLKVRLSCDGLAQAIYWRLQSIGIVEAGSQRKGTSKYLPVRTPPWDFSQNPKRGSGASFETLCGLLVQRFREPVQTWLRCNNNCRCLLMSLTL